MVKPAPGYTIFNKNNSDKKLALLDIGCGSGRDLAEFHAAGVEVTGADVSDEMLKQAALKYPQIGGNLINSGLPELSGINGKFDIILCSGVMQHIQTQHLYESFRTISSLLNDEGIFIFSFPIEYPDINKETLRDKNGRLFIIRPEEKYRFLIERQGLKQICQHRSKTSGFHRSKTAGFRQKYIRSQRLLFSTGPYMSR